VARYADTQHAIKKGLDQVAAEAGITLLDDWIEQLKGADKPGVAGVAKDLARLKAELGKGAPKADAVLKLVLKPGVAATRLADAAEGTKGEKLRTLGEALTNAGQAHDAEGAKRTAELDGCAQLIHAMFRLSRGRAWQRAHIGDSLNTQL